MINDEFARRSKGSRSMAVLISCAKIITSKAGSHINICQYLQRDLFLVSS